MNLDATRNLDRRIGATLRDTFHFAGARCDRMVPAVMERITGLGNG